MNVRTIPEAHFNVCKYIMENGYIYTVQRGSFETTQRKQVASLSLKIERPYVRPLGSHLNGIQLSDDESIYTYFTDYLISPDIPGNEQYTYGERIAPWLELVAKMLTDTPNTNQATIEVGRPEDVLLKDPPCLRVLSWKVTPEGLQLATFWRSWDAYAGLPTNLGGIQLLNETMAEWVNVTPGPIIAFSDGAHVYQHAWEMLK